MQKEIDPNSGKTFIYTESCRMCGTDERIDPVVKMIKEGNQKPVVKQLSLWVGWRREAGAISEKTGVDLPFVFCYDTQKAISLDEAHKNGIDSILS